MTDKEALDLIAAHAVAGAADEACDCRECDGQGSYDQWKAVAGHYEGGEVFRFQCEHCDGTGKAP